MFAHKWKALVSRKIPKKGLSSSHWTTWAKDRETCGPHCPALDAGPFCYEIFFFFFFLPIVSGVGSFSVVTGDTELSSVVVLVHDAML